MTFNGFLDLLTVVKYLSTGHSLVDLEDAHPLHPPNFFIFIQFSTYIIPNYRLVPLGLGTPGPSSAIRCYYHVNASYIILTTLNISFRFSDKSLIFEYWS